LLFILWSALTTIQIDQGVITSATKRGLRPTAIPDMTARARSVFNLDSDLRSQENPRVAASRSYELWSVQNLRHGLLDLRQMKGLGQVQASHGLEEKH
jgi:hypothetical protein